MQEIKVNICEKNKATLYAVCGIDSHMDVRVAVYTKIADCDMQGRLSEWITRDELTKQGTNPIRFLTNNIAAYTVDELRCIQKELINILEKCDAQNCIQLKDEGVSTKEAYKVIRKYFLTIAEQDKDKKKSERRAFVEVTNGERALYILNNELKVALKSELRQLKFDKKQFIDNADAQLGVVVRTGNREDYGKKIDGKVKYLTKLKLS